MHLLFGVVHRAVAQLQQLARQRGRLHRGDGLGVDFQQALVLHLLVGVPILGRQHDGNVLDDLLRQLEVVGCLDADCHVRQLGLDGILGPFARLPAVNLHPVALVRLEVAVSVLGESLPEPLTLVEQIYLCPQIHVILGGWCACQLHHPVDVRAHPAQCLEALGAVVLEARRLIQDDHVKRPPPPVAFLEPDHVVSVGYVDVGLFTKGPLSLLCCAQNGAHAQPLQVLPLLGFVLPRRLSHFLRRDDEHLADIAQLQQCRDCRQRHDRLAQSHLQP